MKKEAKKMIWIAVVVIVLIGGGIYAWNASQSSPTTNPVVAQNLLMNANSHTNEVGTRTYPVTLIEFGDYECPACGAAYPIVKQLVANNPQIKFVFRNFPLSQHPFAQIAAEAAEAAAAQGKFWEMHDAIYANQNIWVTMQSPLDAFVKMATELGLNVQQFQSDVTSNKYAAVINKDMADGNALGIYQTPTFFINGQMYVGPTDYNDLQQAVNQAQQESATQQTSSQQS